jgi:Cap4 dsDNA endonuclease
MGEIGPDFAENQTAWPSIDDAKPNEEGGPIARAGFNYQDEIAVGFLIEMLETPTLLKVHCETHDDVVLVRQSSVSDKREAEYVQVKASAQDKLWSLADLCQRQLAKPGTSICPSSELLRQWAVKIKRGSGSSVW